jgi:hypothetical protein
MEVQEILGSMELGESRVIETSESYVCYMIKIPVSSNMLEAEDLIQSSLNEVGKQATEHALSRFDTDGY